MHDVQIMLHGGQLLVLLLTQRDSCSNRSLTCGVVSSTDKVLLYEGPKKAKALVCFFFSGVRESVLAADLFTAERLFPGRLA